jgi:hypothetical protein
VRRPTASDLPLAALGVVFAAGVFVAPARADAPEVYAPLHASPGLTRPLSARFAAPEGYARVPLPAGSFGAWLRDLPIRVDRETVRAFDGRTLERPAAAIVALDVSPRDLQQCADTALRLHAEWLWAHGRATAAAYHFTSGDRSAYADWLKGERFERNGVGVRRVAGAPRPAGRATYRAWLERVFGYAGSRSLARDTTAVGLEAPLTPGDLFVAPGSPGHVVVLLDVAESPAGRRVALVGQGFMPAEDLHVLRAPNAMDGVWFPLPDAGGTLDTPSWAPFPRETARRFVVPRGGSAP